MTVAAKPATYTVNTAHTHCPDHLWMMDEGAGTTLTDKGKTGGKNLTLSATSGAGPDWVTDGTHGPVLDFVAANQDKATVTGLSGLSGTHTFGIIVNAALGTAQRVIAGLSDPSQTDRYCELVYQGDEDLEAVVRFDDTVATNASTQALTHGSWDFVAIRMSDTIFDWSLNGSAWAAGSHSHAGMIAAFTAFALGYHNTSSPGNFWDELMCAAMWWKADKAVADIYGTVSGSSWTFMATTTKKLKLLVDDDAQSDSAVEGEVYAAPSGQMTGAKIGYFSGAAFEATLEGGQAVLKVPVADFGGSALTVADTPVACVRNASFTTGIIAGTVIEE